MADYLDPRWCCPRCRITFRIGFPKTRDGFCKILRAKSICAEDGCNVRFDTTWLKRRGRTRQMCFVWITPDEVERVGTIVEEDDPALFKAIKEPLDAYLKTIEQKPPDHRLIGKRRGRRR